MRGAEDQKPQIFVNVYHANQDEVSGAAVEIPGCCGAYHTGVEISGTEYAFGAGSGIYECSPGDYGALVEKVDMGTASLSNRDIKRIIDRLRLSFPGDSYHLILNNCNCFSDELVRTCCSRRIPAWINRAAWWASWFKCCFPKQDISPVLGESNLSGPPRQFAPLFTGEGVTLSSGDGQATKNLLTAEEQRQVRLRTFGLNQ